VQFLRYVKLPDLQILRTAKVIGSIFERDPHGTALADDSGMSAIAPPDLPPQPPKLLDRVRTAIRLQHFGPRTEEWRWQFVFPVGRICRDPRWGAPSRFHLHESVVQRAVTEAARRAGLTKRVSLPRVSVFVCDPSAGGWRRYPHGAGIARSPRCEHDHGSDVMNRGALGVKSPMDRL